ncbi:MAG: hypothetical protein Q9M97_00430 [Candidatus Gracilibacteria bacterium]|nr:hypothetical protein [Candidatus Gracilibacteria bacterium]
MKFIFGVDEHSFSGHDMVLIITELKTGQLLAVLDGITKTKLDYWIWHVVPLKCHKKLFDIVQIGIKVMQIV